MKKILVSGSTGTVGRNLIDFLSPDSFKVFRLVRSYKEKTPDIILWDPSKRRLGDRSLLEDFDAVVHLSGESVVGRWSTGKKNRMRESRVFSTRFLVDMFSGLKKPPRTFICASAVGYYGDRGDEELTESSSAGTGFLSELCCEWESEAQRASDLATRVINLRIGVVLSRKGGILGSLLPPFRMGLGGVVGSGNQYISWVSIDDLCRMIGYLVQNEGLSGCINAVSPAPVTNREFTRTLAGFLGKPSWLSIPGFAIETFFGEMGHWTMLASTRVLPRRLQSSGYVFTHGDLRRALEEVVTR